MGKNAIEVTMYTLAIVAYPNTKTASQLWRLFWSFIGLVLSVIIVIADITHCRSIGHRRFIPSIRWWAQLRPGVPPPIRSLLSLFQQQSINESKQKNTLSPLFSLIAGFCPNNIFHECWHVPSLQSRFRHSSVPPILTSSVTTAQNINWCNIWFWSFGS